MPSTRRLRSALGLASAALVTLGAAPAAASPPRGYVVVHSGLASAAAGKQTRGFATCPAGTVPLGGGVETPLNDPLAVNSSFPTATGWVADVDNAAATASTFDVGVACGRRPKGYFVAQAAPVAVPAGGVATSVALCPPGSSPLGGGGFSDSTLVSVNLGATYPVPGQWRVLQGNASSVETHVAAVAVCGQLRGYRIHAGSLGAVPFGIVIGGVGCGPRKVPVGGGVFTNATNPDVTVGATFLDLGTWATYLVNAAPHGPEVLGQRFVVCAGG